MAKNYGLLAFAIFAAAALVYLQFSPQIIESGGKPSEQTSTPTPKAQEPKGRETPFDFYVLALSWSPSFCASEGANKGQQCGANQDYGFVVHGLWPQNNKGYPEFCASSEPDRVNEALGRQMFDIMPSMGLIGHQWRKHGTCSGLKQKEYFDLTRQAYNAIQIPDTFKSVSLERSISASSVEEAFIKANQSLKPDQIAVTCSNGMIDEVRICMNSNLAFQSCPEVNQRSCRAKSSKLPPQ